MVKFKEYLWFFSLKLEDYDEPADWTLPNN